MRRDNNATCAIILSLELFSLVRHADQTGRVVVVSRIEQTKKLSSPLLNYGRSVATDGCVLRC